MYYNIYIVLYSLTVYAVMYQINCNMWYDMIWCNFISTTDIIILHYIVSVYNNYTLHLHIIQLIIPYRHHIVFFCHICPDWVSSILL